MAKTGYISLLLGAVLLLTGCTAADEDIVTVGSDEPVTFDIEIASRAGTDDPNDLLSPQFINGQSVILISQRGENLSLDFNDYVDSDGTMVPNPNLYKYVYYTNPNADWDQGYNFQPYGTHELNWDAISANGTLNGEYTLGALLYPVGYEVNNTIERDQSVLNNLLRSNILAAYHKTNQIRSRLRFRFYHLMAGVRVRLLIPDWSSQDGTGFGENAVQSASMLSIRPNFSIDWPGNIGTEDYPVPQIPDDAPYVDIKMYIESVSNEVKRINLRDINPEFPDEEDNYREATFLMLLPPQSPTTAGPAMRFVLNSISGMERRYIWYASDLVGSSAIEFSRNGLTTLTLYLPRTDNDAILVKSYIVPWDEAESQFSVVPD